MKKIITIDVIALSRLNNAEYTNFISRTLAEAQLATAIKLGITEADLLALSENLDKMQDIVAQSRISDDTALLATIDKERSTIIVYIIAEVENKRRSPIAEEKEAAISLYNALHVYSGVQTLPAQQKTQFINGFVGDCAKAENLANVRTLGLEESVNKLDMSNIKYAETTEHRTISNASSHLESGKEVREANDPLYKYIVTMAFTTSVSSPSPEAERFVKEHNALIKETKTLYYMRTAKKRRPEEETDSDMPAM